MKPFNKPLSLAITSLILGYAASSVAQDRTFGYLHAVSGQNQISIDNRCGPSPCAVYWSTLSHGALQQRSDWAVFVTPILGINGVGDAVVGPTPDGGSGGAFDFHVNYQFGLGDGKYFISRSRENQGGSSDPGLHYDVEGAYGVGVTESAASSIISLANVAPTVDTNTNRPKYFIDHVLLNNHPESIPVLSVRQTSASAGLGATNFLCSSFGYDATRQKWYITSLCAYNRGSSASPNYYWSAVDVYINVTQPGIQGFKHNVTAGNRFTPCRAMAECSLIDDPLVNSRPDAVLIVSRGNPAATSQDVVGVRYNVSARRWQLECIPYQEYGGATTNCLLVNNAEYHIWVPTTVTGKNTATTTFVPLTSASNDYPISSSSFTPSVSPAMQQMISSELGAHNSAQTILSYNPGSRDWALGTLDFSPFAARSSYAIHTFSSGQNAYLHKTPNSGAPSYFSRIDQALLNGRDSFFVVQSVHNPFGLADGGVTANQNVGLYWDATTFSWAIALENPAATLTGGSYYHVLMPERFQSTGEADASMHPRGFRQVADASNTSGACTVVTNPDWRFDHNVRLFVSHVIKDPSAPFPSFLDSPISTVYSFFSWQICRNDGLAMPLGAQFNVMAYDNLDDRIFANSYD